jgi:chromosome segregation ATPase
MTIFTDKMEKAGIDAETAKGWEKDLLDRLQKQKTRRDTAQASIRDAQKELNAANDTLASLKATLGLTGDV